jgi:hypothetical protein
MPCVCLHEHKCTCVQTQRCSACCPYTQKRDSVCGIYQSMSDRLMTFTCTCRSRAHVLLFMHVRATCLLTFILFLHTFFCHRMYMYRDICNHVFCNKAKRNATPDMLRLQQYCLHITYALISIHAYHSCVHSFTKTKHTL